MTFKNNLITQSFFSVSGFILPAILLLFSFQLISNYFSPKYLSIFLILNTFITIGTALDLGLKINLVKTVSSDLKTGKSFINSLVNYVLIILSISIFFSLAIFIFKPYLVQYFSNFDSKTLNIALTYFCIFFSSHHLAICLTFFYEGLNNFKSSFQLKLMKSILTNIFPIFYCIFSNNFDFTYFIKAFTFGQILSLFLMIIYIYFDLKEKILESKFKIFTFREIRSTLKLSNHIFLNTLLGILFVQFISLYVFSNFKSEVSNIFKIISIILGYINQFFASMFMIILPIFSNENFNKMKNKISYSFKLNLALSSVGYISLVIFITFITNNYYFNFSLDSLGLSFYYLAFGYFLSTTKYPLVLSAISFEKPQIISIHNSINFIICSSIILFKPANIDTVSLIFLGSQIISYFAFITAWRYYFK